MAGFFKSLFSSADIIKTGVDAIINTGDALVYTPEEQARSAERKQTWYLELMKTLSPSAKSRRGVAWAIVGMVSFLSIVGVICKLIGWADDATWVLKLLTDVWSWPFVSVVTFYFVLPGTDKVPSIKAKTS
jgi:hypothetical protein